MSSIFEGKEMERRYHSQIYIGIGIILLAVLATVAIFVFKPAPERGEQQPKATLVETEAVKESNEPITVVGYGTVQPHRKLTVQAEVKGRIIEQSPHLDAGGLLKEGEVMLKIDPRDYIAAVEDNRGKVEKAEFELIVEKGKKLIAEKEWNLLDESLKQGGVGKELALRIPHIREKEAALRSAQFGLEKALIDLKRTVLRAPFNSLVLEEFVEIGQLVSTNTNIATLVSTDEFRVQVSVPYDQLSWISLPQKIEKTLPVKVIQDLGNGQKIVREGTILRILGDLDPNGRMVQLLVVIKDPLGIENGDAKKVPLLLGTYVEVQIEGPTVKGALTIPRKALHEDNKVWVMNSDGKLEIQQVEVIGGDKEHVIVKSGLKAGDKVIVSNLPAAIPGMELREAS